MAWGIPDNLEFTPKQVLRYFDGHIVVGVDGELQKIDLEGNLVGQGREASKQVLSEDPNLMAKITAAILEKVEVTVGDVLAQGQDEDSD